MDGIDRSIIILSRNFEPICKTSPEKAFCLLYTNRAVPYEFTDPSLREFVALRAVNDVYNVPKMIILRTTFDINKILHRGFLLPTRRYILMRDNNKCGYCGKKATTLDHIKPVSKGGKNTWENLVAACAKCNNVKADKELNEIGMKLQITPRALTPYDLMERILGEFADIIQKDSI